MKNVFDLLGKVAIVTGASTGLGAGMTLGLAEAGADIALVDRAGEPGDDGTSPCNRPAGAQYHR
jgi:NAD(P)-dependent dehydrogenase (short-subunit alcohol dehydrogenase family)